jgi:hypothetical protein
MFRSVTGSNDSPRYSNAFIYEPSTNNRTIGVYAISGRISYCFGLRSEHSRILSKLSYISG